MTRDEALSLRPGARLRFTGSRLLLEPWQPGTATLVRVKATCTGPALALRHDGERWPDPCEWHPDWWEVIPAPAPAWQPCPDCAATGREAADPDTVCAACGGNGGHYAQPQPERSPA